MKRSKFSEAQIAFVLKQAEDGTSVGEVCRKAGISEATFYNWRKKYAGLMPSEMKRLRQLEEENAKLKRLVADENGGGILGHGSGGIGPLRAA
ncbi:putative transposase [Sphingobium sp. AEW010]|nr:putative transposase [Sphingobium sp. JAI105]TWC97404.1 putative transposase [Sphingobium sp. AEW010]TWD17784.1 putative transposase [Sphingobium sp. AEW013]TWD20020.1 putative transposase [Sphingobium sp. AEW001]